MNQLYSPEKQEITIDANQLKVDVEQVLSGLGMKRTDADEYLLNLINELIIKCLKLARPRASFSLFKNPEFDFEKKTVHILSSEFQLGNTITGMLKKSEAIFLFAATVGHDIDVFSKQQMKEGNSLEGYIIDLIGSELAETTTDYLHNYLEEMVNAEGFGLSNRYSPGYCNWPVSDQHQLFSLLGDANCGITVNESSLMSPIKSVSGIVGVGKGLKRVDYKCRLCNDEKCILRHQF